MVTKTNDEDTNKQTKASDGGDDELDDNVIEDNDDEIGLSPEEMEAVKQQKLEEKEDWMKCITRRSGSMKKNGIISL